MTTVMAARRVPTVAAWGLAATAVLVVGVMILVTAGSYEQWGAFVIACVVVAVSVPVLKRSAVRHGERALLALFILGLLLRIGGAVLHSYSDFEVYGGRSDSAYYDRSGLEIAERFQSGNFDTGLPSLTGTNFIRYFTGIVYWIIGPSRLGAFMLFAALGFWGCFLLYRAFTIAVPEGRAHSYARLIFLLPSFWFWPSGIGKEGWMMLSLGIAAIGAARMLSGRPARGLLVATGGLWLAAIVRPHVAGAIAIALATAVVIRRPERARGYLTPVARGATFGAVALLAFLLVARTEVFLSDRGVETSGGIIAALEATSERAAWGGSYAPPNIASSPREVPKAIITVLFRPFPTEAHNSQALATSAETSFVFLLVLVRFRWALNALRLLRTRPYLALAAAHTALMIFMLSQAANLGLLARQRIQLLPFFLALLCVPPKTDDSPAGAAVGDARR